MINTETARLYDILFSGPTYIWYGYYLDNENYKKILYLFGFLTILVNSSYYLYNKGISTKVHDIISIDILEDFTNEKNNKYNKTQFNRFLLVFIVYPLVYRSLKYYSEKGPKILYQITVIKLIIGYLYNLFFFIKYLI